MIKKRLAIFKLLCTFFIVSAQSLSLSPYSSFGLGEIKFNNSANLNSMGSIGTVYVSELGTDTNFDNPANNKNLFLTNFNVGLNSDNIKIYGNNNQSEKHSSTYVSNISIAFPINAKIKFGLGYQPYSAVGYDFKNQIVTQGNLTGNQRNYGEGGLNSVHSFISYSKNKSLSFGLRLNYLTGNIAKNSDVILDNNILRTSEIYKNHLNTFRITPGLYYSKNLKKNYILSAGATYTFESSLKNDFKNIISVHAPTETPGIPFDERFILNENKIEKVKMPSEFSVGLGLGKEQKWLLATQYSSKLFSGFALPQDANIYNNQYKISAGGWIIPNANSYKSYLARTTYRLGAYYENTGLNIQNKDIKQYAISMGMSLPIGNIRQNSATIDFGFELGKRTSGSNDLIKEDFANFKLNLNFSDRWFRKRTFN